MRGWGMGDERVRDRGLREVRIGWLRGVRDRGLRWLGIGGGGG